MQYALRFALIATFICFLQIQVSADSFKIALNSQSRLDPLIEWFGPVSGTRHGDQVLVQADASGTRITLPKGDSIDTNVSTGFQFLVPAAGDFKWELDLECLELQKPLSGWGQGISMRVHFNDKDRTKLLFGWCSRPGDPPMALIAKESLRANTNSYEWMTERFKAGTLSIDRSGDQATMSIIRNKSSSIVGTMQVPKSDITHMDVYVSRLETGNTVADFVLKETRLTADSHPALRSPAPQRSWWTVIYGLEAMILLALGMLLGMRWYKKRTP